MKKLVINKQITIKTITRVALFGAIATILYVVPIFTFNIPIFPFFLEFKFSEIPLFIAGFAYGPLTSVLALLITILIKLPFSTTAFVGEFADLIYSLAFVLPAVIVYRRHRNIKGVLIGFTVGFFVQLVVSSLANALFVIDFYIIFFQLPEVVLLSLVSQVNPMITDVRWTMVLYGILPFNIVKNLLVILITFLSYKRVYGALARINA